MKILIYIMNLVSIVSCSEQNIIDKNSTNIVISGYFKHETSGEKHIFSIQNNLLIVNSVKNGTLSKKGNTYQLTRQALEMLNNPPKVLLHKNKTLGKGYYGRYYIFTFHHDTKYSNWKVNVMYKFTDAQKYKYYLIFLKNILKNAYNERKLKVLNIIKN